MVLLGEHPLALPLDHVGIDNVAAALHRHPSPARPRPQADRRHRPAPDPRHGRPAPRRVPAGAPAEAGLPQRPRSSRPRCATTTATVRRPWPSCSRCTEPPDAVFCFNDMLALGADPRRGRPRPARPRRHRRRRVRQHRAQRLQRALAHHHRAGQGGAREGGGRPRAPPRHRRHRVPTPGRPDPVRPGDQGEHHPQLNTHQAPPAPGAAMTVQRRTFLTGAALAAGAVLLLHHVRPPPTPTALHCGPPPSSGCRPVPSARRAGSPPSSTASATASTAATRRSPASCSSTRRAGSTRTSTAGRRCRTGCADTATSATSPATPRCSPTPNAGSRPSSRPRPPTGTSARTVLRTSRTRPRGPVAAHADAARSALVGRVPRRHPD